MSDIRSNFNETNKISNFDKTDLIGDVISEKTQLNLQKIEIEKLKGEIEFLKGTNDNLKNEIKDLKYENEKTKNNLSDSENKTKLLETKLEYIEKDNKWLKSMYEELYSKSQINTISNNVKENHLKLDMNQLKINNDDNQY